MMVKRILLEGYSEKVYFKGIIIASLFLKQGIDIKCIALIKYFI